MDNNIALSVRGVSKTFKLPTEKRSGIKQAALGVFKGRRSYKTQRVLRSVSFDIEKGDFFGIVGRNGSGKSTLLKTMANIYSPNKGSVVVNGSLTPFIELGVGFNHELTGRENVYMNGALLGFSHREMDKMYDDIVEFAELDKFMDQKLKNYSSGMQVRLAFSIAIRAKSDILILDEVLAVGDEAFQRKCNDYFDAIRKDKSKTVILVTHNMAAVKQYCNRALMLEGGRVVSIGSPEDVANSYTIANYQSTSTKSAQAKAGAYVMVRPISPQVLTDEKFVEFEVEYRTFTEDRVYVSHAMILGDSVVLCSDDSREYATSDKNVHILRYRYPIDQLNNMEIKINAAVAYEKDSSFMLFTDSSQVAYFKISDEKNRFNHFAVNIRGEWEKVK